MNPPEERHYQEESPVLSQKEQLGQPIFYARFGFGLHGKLNLSDWPDILKQDLDSFFHSPDAPQRNIFYMEDMFGSRSRLDKINRAYKTYGSYATAFKWEWLYSAGYIGMLRAEEPVVPAEQIDRLFENAVAESSSQPERESFLFTARQLSFIDDIVERKNIQIELAIETRRNIQERGVAKLDLKHMDSAMLSSVEDLRQYTIRIWNSNKLREQKIADDLSDIYKKAFREKLQTRVYVVLGNNHEPIRDSLAKKLGQRPSYAISYITGSLRPPYDAVGNIFKEMLSHLNSGSQISSEQWKGFSERLSALPPELPPQEVSSQ